MTTSISRFKIYTSIEEVDLYRFVDEVDVYFDPDIVNNLGSMSFSTYDILLLSSQDAPSLKSFPGIVIIKVRSNDAIEFTDDLHHSLYLQNRGFKNNLITLINMQFKLLKIKNEKDHLASHLVEVVDEFSKLKKNLHQESELTHKKDARLALLNHETKTPLNLIVGHLDLLIKTELNEKQKTYIGQISKAVRTLNETLEGILLYENTLEESTIKNNISFNFEEDLAELHKSMKSAAEARHLLYTVFYDPALAKSFIADGKKIRILIKQLITNALKFTHEGSIKFEVNCIEQNNEQQIIELCIEDTGKGFNIEDLPELYKPFQQGEHHLQREYDGLGLGLTIANSMIQVLEGSVEVNSEIGKGTRFTIRLNLNIDTDAETNLDIPPTILVVDDNALNRNVMRTLLEDEGIRIMLARNGKEALELMNHHSEEIDLILMDLIMPVMDGFEASRRLRELEYTTPIVVISASITEIDANQLRLSKINDFIVKDHQINKYMDHIRKYIRVPEHKKQVEKSQVDNDDLINTPLKSIKVSDLLHRYDNRLSLILKILEGILLQLDLFNGHWLKLKKDSHDDDLKIYFHSLKGLLRSIGNLNLSQMIEDLEKELHPDELTKEYYDQILEHISVLKEDITLLSSRIKNKLKENTDETVVNNISDDHLDELLNRLNTHLKDHDVNSIRKVTKDIQLGTDGTACADYFSKLIQLLENYQYDEAINWLIKDNKTRGDRNCSF